MPASDKVAGKGNSYSTRAFKIVSFSVYVAAAMPAGCPKTRDVTAGGKENGAIFPVIPFVNNRAACFVGKAFSAGAAPCRRQCRVIARRFQATRGVGIIQSIIGR